MNDLALLMIDMQNEFVLPDAPACVKGAFKKNPKIDATKALTDEIVKAKTLQI